MSERQFPYGHTSPFTGNPPQEFLSQIAAIYRQVAASMGLQTIHVWTRKDNDNGAVFFGSNNFKEKAILELRLFGERVTIRGFTHEQEFTGGNMDYIRAWVGGAKSLLADQAINYVHTELSQDRHLFEFDKASDLLYFSGLHFSGHMDALVKEPLRELPYTFADFFTPPRNILG